MNKLLLIIITFFICTYTFSQNQQQITTDLVEVNSINHDVWLIYLQNSEFKIEYKYTNCDPSRGFDFEGVIFKITNLSSNKIALSWHKLLYYAGSCRTCDYPEEYSFTISIEPNSSIEGNCNPDSGYNLKLFSKFIDQAYSQGDQLTSFKLGNLSIQQ